ncbi:MAG: type II toxin-antitoxin system death-on-curing family toxin, partial [Gemmatimonadota bacterium]
SPGIRDEGLIESALARPRQKWGYEEGADLALLAAAYAFGLVQNHGSVDGNKRVGAAAMGVFLNLNGFEVEAPEPKLVSAILAVASSEWDEGTLVEWFRERVVSFSDDEATEDRTY